MKNSRIFAGILYLLAAILAVPLSGEAATPSNGVQVTALTTFNNTNNGANPFDAPIFGPGGNLYGTTDFGGTANPGTTNATSGSGVVFQTTLSGSNTTLYVFTNGTDGANPGSVTAGPDGDLYGVANNGGTNGDGTIFKITTDGVFSLLHTFGSVTNGLGYSVDGSLPYGILTLGSDGNFYGVTYQGGVSNIGTVFQFSPADNTLTTLHEFTGDDGANPFVENLVEGQDGVFYGDTYTGGVSNNGTIFRITTTGDFTSLYQFTNNAGPYAGLTFGPDGNLYGLTLTGGTNSDGSAFRVTTNGDLTTFFTFNATNGLFPEGPLVFGSNGTMFGATYEGGTSGEGTLFSLTTNGVQKIFFTFDNKADGSNPEAGVIRGADGNLYGTAEHGGNGGGYGVVYQLTDLFVPTNVISAPAPNLHWSNAVFNVVGIVRDNVGGVESFYSLNGSDWTMVIPADGTNWTAQINLAAGANTLRAFATDSFGHISATNSVSFIYVPGFNTALLTVRTNGAGSISPGLNNLLLFVGTNYSMTAKPAKGSVFVNWTDGNSNVVSTSATLKFTMTPGLTLVANFADVTDPALTVTSPKSGAKWTNTTFTVTGTVSDNIAVSNVLYSLNGATWTNASFSSGGGNWTALVNLITGTNTISVYAIDPSGNTSPTNVVKLIQIPGAVVTVIMNGGGKLKPNYNGALLALGHSYTMKATPTQGYIFYYWNVGDTMSNSPSLTFTMVTNLTITANFKDVELPTVAISTPTSREKCSNSVITVTGQAYDANVALTNAYVQINDNGWVAANPTYIQNTYYTWEATNLPVNVGTNTVRACSVNAVGNISRTNTITFAGYTPPDWAPESLSNSTMLVIFDGGTSNMVSFGTNTFSQADTNITGDSGTGIYSYDKTSTNTAGLALTFVASPGMTNSSNPQDFKLTFTSLYAGAFTNLTTGTNGTFIFQDVGSADHLLPKAWTGHTVTLSTNASSTNTMAFKLNKSDVVDIIPAPRVQHTGTYELANVSPEGAMLVVTDTNNAGNVAYVQLMFTSTRGGRYEINNYDSGGTFQNVGTGTFTYK